MRNRRGSPKEEEEQFTLRSGLGGIIRISRIPIPDALYCASVAAQTFETVNETITNPIDCDDIVYVNVAKVIEAYTHDHIPGFEEFIRSLQQSANRVNRPK